MAHLTGATATPSGATAGAEGAEAVGYATAAGERQAELIALVVERNPFQRQRVDALGLGAAPALEELPPLTKRELIEDQAEHPPFGTNLTYPLDHYTQVWQTSGTTGRPLRVLDTGEDWSWWRRLFA